MHAEMGALSDKALVPAGPLSAGHRLGRYEVLAKLASGGMAVVYIGRAQGAAGFERLFALKVLHANLAYEEEFIRMFLDEARLAARIRHPNVVPTIDINDSVQTGFFLVMEYIEGDHLGALLSAAHKQAAQIPVPVVLRIVADALAGLGAAHDLRDDSGKSLQLVHRDVSPHNILVGRDGVARLTDFGVAKAEDRLTHTRDGQVKGKLAYMAPEQASTGTSDSRSDLFSIGIILWECLTRRRLFRAENTAATLTKLMSEEIAPPSAIDPALAPLDPVLRKALDRDPQQRFQTAEELIDALESAGRRFGGLASRRAVAKVVKQLAADKLARDRKLITSAQRALRAGELQAIEPGPESIPQLADGSVSSFSAARSKPSGVFANLTAPALFTRGRSARPAAGPSVTPSGPQRTATPAGLLAPPPLGGVALEAFAGRGRARARWPLLVLGALSLTLLALLALWLWPTASPAPHDTQLPELSEPRPPAAPAPVPPASAVPSSAAARSGAAVPAPSTPVVVPAPHKAAAPEPRATQAKHPNGHAAARATHAHDRPQPTAPSASAQPPSAPDEPAAPAPATAPPEASPAPGTPSSVDLLPNPYKR